MEKKNLIDEKYMEWLESFSQTHDVTFTNDALPKSVTRNSIDEANIQKLYKLFELTKNYAEKHQLRGEKSEYGEAYKIQNNGIGYEIGVLFSNVYYERLSTKPNSKCIEFGDIISFASNKEHNEHEEQVNKLQEELGQILGLNVPHEVAMGVVTKKRILAKTNK